MEILFWVVFCGVAILCAIGAIIAIVIDAENQKTYEIQGVRSTTVMLFGFLVFLAVCLFARRTAIELQEQTCPPPTTAAECIQAQKPKDPSPKPTMSSVEESSNYFGKMVGGFVHGVMSSKEPETVPYFLSSSTGGCSCP